MPRVTIVLSDEEEGFELTAHVTFEPEMEITPDTDFNNLPAPHRAAMIGMTAINAMSNNGAADVTEMYDREGNNLGDLTDPREPPEPLDPWAA